MEGIVEVFGADCDTTDQQLLISRHKPEPLPPLATPVTLTADHYGRVPRAYIETAHDNCVSHALQIKMIERVGVGKRVLLASSHSPFLAMPTQLVAALLELN